METGDKPSDQQKSKHFAALSDAENKKAAELIQTVRDAQYQHLTRPAAPQSRGKDDAISAAKSRWNQVIGIAQHAGADDVSMSGSSEFESASGDERGDEQRAEKTVTDASRKKTAKMMDLQYFLEMVDQKHRYGSNLRKYHAYWKTQDTQESFFYWLDQGQGMAVSVPECSRKRLETMQVRYLSRAERQNYLVQIDENGAFVWAKNGDRVWTKDELYRDSIKGIVPTNDPTPEFQYNTKPDGFSSSDEGSESEEDATISEGEQYVNRDFHRARGPAKLKQVSAAVLFNHMIRKSLKKGHKWIFVADTSFRLYIGYKQSGAFQHSSFLHGSRILAAGLIKVKDGQLRSLSPLSGHYRPPAASFRAFVHSLKEEGADMSRVSISKSYAVLVGMEGYTKGQKRVQTAEEVVVHQVDKVVRPEKAKQDELEKHDKSQSAEKERLHLEQQRYEQNQGRKQKNPARRMSQRLMKLFHRPKRDAFDKDRGIAGTGPEDGIPPPEGQR